MTLPAALPDRPARTTGHERPVRRPPLLRELALGLAVFALYAAVTGLDGAARERAAHRHGYALLHLERALGIGAEEWLNRALVPHHALRVVANYEYAFTYLVSALWLMVWLYLRRPATYRWARNWFVLINLIALGTFAVYPVAPPRLLAGAGFVDTVTAGHTFGSWGSPYVEHANELAAMPSLHIGWALWVSMVLACVSSRWWIQVGSALHVTVTTLVILATANHYLLDALGGALLVWVSLALVAVVPGRLAGRRAAGTRVAPADAFFLHVDAAGAPQQIGALVELDATELAGGYRDQLVRALAGNLGELPRLAQRLTPGSRWRRPRWVPVPDLDWDWHVRELDIGSAAPEEAEDTEAWLAGVVARAEAEPLPRDRPLWRFTVLTGFAPDRVAAVLVLHHVLADGIGTIAALLPLLEPVPPMPPGPPHTPLPRRVAAVVSGLAQLAADGRSRYPLPGSDRTRRGYATAAVPLARLREIATAHQARVSDVLLTAVAGALRRVLGERTPPRVRTALPITMRGPGSTTEGNATAAVLVDLPLDGRSEADRLAAVAVRTARLRRSGRALAARWVMNAGCAVLPPPLLGAFARAVYGRRYFQAIVSNVPGPAGSYRLAGAPIVRAYPIVPLAPGAPLAVGALGWDGTLFIGVSADPALLPDPTRLTGYLEEALGDLEPGEPNATNVGLLASLTEYRDIRGVSAYKQGQWRFHS